MIFTIKKKSYSEQLPNSINHCSIKRMNIVKDLSTIFDSKLIFSRCTYTEF